MIAVRPVQMLWLVAAVIFVLALFHTMSGGETGEWLSNTIQKAPFKSHGAPVKPDEAPVKSHQAAAAVAGRPSLEQHVELAEKIWAKTVAQRHEMRKDWPDQANMPFFPAVDYNSYQKTPYSIWDFVPASWSCPYEMERIGRMGDGGKWVCGMSKYEAIPEEKPCIIYSFGVQTESSFEDEMLSRTHCEIWAYDFSVVDFGKQLHPSFRNRAHFTQAGISGETNASHVPPFYTIQDLMIQNGHDYLDILKIDIEYAEFASLRSLSDEFSKSSGREFPIGQVMIEIHLFIQQGITSGEFLSWWEHLEGRGLRATWTEPNLLSTTLHLDDSMTRLAEYTLLNTHDRRNVLFEALH